MSEQAETNWQDVLDAEALPPGGRKVVKADGGKQIALFRLNDGRIKACNNRCPHEGYPLSEGHLDERDPKACLLTCNWHNWKFDLDGGETIVGGDKLRLYPTRETDGRIFVNISDPPADEVIAQSLSALIDSFDRHEYDRMAREIARLEKAGGDPALALNHTIRETADRFEFGTSHAVPASADWLALAERNPDDPVKRLVALAESVGHFAWDGRRAPRFLFPEGELAWDADRFVEAVEAEDETTAIKLARGALSSGLDWSDIAPAFARASLDHYADFGHSAIYTYKLGALLKRLPADDDVREALVSMLARSLVYAPREDLIPEFKAYAPALESWSEAGDAPDIDKLERGSVRSVLSEIASGGSEPEALYDAAMHAAARQMLHFDLKWQEQTDGTVSQNMGWLDFTHTLTFGNAVRKLAERDPALWPAGLLQIGCFLGRNAGFTDFEQDTGRWYVNDAGSFYERILDGLYDHGEFEYIVSAHYLKLTMALDEERRERPEAPWHADAAAALNRLLNSPLKRKHALRTAKQSRAFVAAEG